MAANNSVTEHSIVEEYQYLHAKSQQFFSQLRDLPQYGQHHWQPYFHKTFDIYTKLWKFQQDHRATLENKSLCGLERWEIGEIASKIGQLYYHYYLRTSDTNYLYESYVFYEAIRSREYFKEVVESKSQTLNIKKLRYYARFIVVAFLLNRRDVVKQLLEELYALVQEYKTYKPPDIQEWLLVLQEISSFLQAEDRVSWKGRKPEQPQHSGRLPKSLQSTPEAGKLRLQECVLVGNRQRQVKFSELTLDMFRVLLSLERDPIRRKPEDKADISDGPLAKRTANPHKYLLYRPSISQFMVVLATMFKELQENSAMMVYLSADGSLPHSSRNAGIMYTQGGVVLNSRKHKEESDDGEKAGATENCLYAEDLIPFTRKPMFVIVDSDNSTAFGNFPKLFNSPFVCLMSPTQHPSEIREMSQIGSLFTFFLNSPVLALCSISGVGEVTQEVFEKCEQTISAGMAEVMDLFHTCEAPESYKSFLEDDLARCFLYRYLFCHVCISLHRQFQSRSDSGVPSEYLPTCRPPLPASLLSHVSLVKLVHNVAKRLGVKKMLSESLK